MANHTLNPLAPFSHAKEEGELSEPYPSHLPSSLLNDSVNSDLIFDPDEDLSLSPQPATVSESQPLDSPSRKRSHSSSSSDLDIDALLEQPVNDSSPSRFTGLKDPPEMRDKIVLKHRGTEYFEVLPDGWIEITHSSGIPVYLHKASRVCTLSRPYFLGPGSVRHHGVPLASVPCLYQKRVQQLQKERRERQQRAMIEQSNGDSAGPSCPKLKGMPEVRVQTVEDSQDQNSLSPEALHSYCEKSFEFETIKVWRFRNWSDHRTYHRKQKAKKQRPALPSNVKLITIPALEKGGKPTQKQFFLNPHGKTSVCLLHEYVQRVMHCSPVYEYKETENAASPYSATVIINEHRYATGSGNSKKNAKLDAARRTLAVLIPDVDFNEESTVKLPNQDDVLGLFDLFTITDSRVFELSTKAGQPTPYQILLECLKRNAAFGDTKMETHIRMIKHQLHEYVMRVGGGKHEVKVSCTNKREGKQKASQAMLERLHPHISTWASLLRLYGYGSAQRQGGVKKEEIPQGQKAPAVLFPSKEGEPQAQEKKSVKYGTPNQAILEKLKKEMAKLPEEAEIRGAGCPADLVGETIKSINI